MTTRKYSSRSQQTTLTAALTSSATTATVVSGSSLLGGVTVSAGETFTVVIDPDTALEEIVDVTAVSTNTLTITRGIDGSTGQAHSAGAVVRHMAIGRDYREANTHIESTTGHGATGAVVGTTNTQTLTNKTLTSPTITGTGAIAGTFTGNLTGNVTGNVSGNAGTVTNGVYTTDTGTVTSTMIANGTIVNADINSAAAIDKTKISGTAITAADTGTVTSTMIADGTIVNADVNTSAQIAYGKLNLANSVTNTDINASAAIDWSKIAPSSTVSATELGYLDGVTSAVQTQLDSKLATSTAASTYAPLASPALTGTPTAPTATAGTNTTQVATTAFVKTAVDNVVAAAPGALDTLNELAAALGNDASFSTTVTNSLATKLPLSGGTMTGAIAMGTNKITGLGTPTASTDAATKNYVDTVTVAPSNLTGPITSVGSATSIASQTGTGTKFVMDTSPTLVTPNIGVATATSINGTTIPSSKTLVATDSTAYVVPSQTGNSGKALTTDGTTSSWSATINGTAIPASKTLVDTTTAQTLTNKTLTSPALTTPSISNIDAKGDILVGTANDTLGVLSVGNNGETIVADSSTATGLRYTGGTVQSNPVLNSSYQIWQRGTSVSATNGNAYTADRWMVATGPSMTCTISRQATGDTTNLPNIQYCARVQRNSGQTATGNWTFQQSMESINSIPFAGKTVTLSFYARKGANFSAASDLMTVGFYSGTGTDQNFQNGYTGTVNIVHTTQAITSTWVRYTFTGSVPATSTEMALVFGYAATATAGANDYYEITGVQIDVGSVALPFRTYAGTIQGELAACQRYYVRRNANSTYAYLTNSGVAYDGSSTRNPISLTVPMRVYPTSFDYSGIALSDSINQFTTGTWTLVQDGTTSTPTVGYTHGSSALTQFRAYFIQAANNASAYVGFSAEL